MSDLVTAVGLFLVFEGILYAGLPSTARRLAFEASQMDESVLRRGGIIAMLIGIFVVWLVRG